MGAFNNLIVESLGTDKEWEGFVDLNEDRETDCDESQLELHFNELDAGFSCNRVNVSNALSTVYATHPM